MMFLFWIFSCQLVREKLKKVRLEPLFSKEILIEIIILKVKLVVYSLMMFWPDSLPWVSQQEHLMTKLYITFIIDCKNWGQGMPWKRAFEPLSSFIRKTRRISCSFQIYCINYKCQHYLNHRFTNKLRFGKKRKFY